jgi:hypothetical protein
MGYLSVRKGALGTGSYLTPFSGFAICHAGLLLAVFRSGSSFFLVENIEAN